MGIHLKDSLPETLAMDGKMIGDIIGMVSLVQTEDGDPVAMAIMDQKEGTERCELKAAQKLITQLPDLENKTVTADPLHCQRQSARMIVEKGGNYLFQIKGNQPNLYKVAQQEVLASPFYPSNPRPRPRRRKNRLH